MPPLCWVGSPVSPSFLLKVASFKKLLAATGRSHVDPSLRLVPWYISKRQITGLISHQCLTTAHLSSVVVLIISFIWGARANRTLGGLRQDSVRTPLLLSRSLGSPRVRWMVLTIAQFKKIQYFCFHADLFYIFLGHPPTNEIAVFIHLDITRWSRNESDISSRQPITHSN